MRHYIGIPTCHVSVVKLGAGICHVPTTGAVTTDEANGYTCILRLHTFPSFADMDQPRVILTPDLRGCYEPPVSLRC